MSDNIAAQVARLRAIIDGEQYQESGDRAALRAGAEALEAVEVAKAALVEAHEGAARQLAEPRSHDDDQWALTAIATTCEAALARLDGE